MKNIFTLIATVILSTTIWAQSPQKMSYQAVIRNASSELIKNLPVGMRVSILKGTATGTEVFKEIYNPNPQTNVNGLVSLEIGTGIALTSSFPLVNWASGPYFIKIETDPSGGTNYSVVSTSELLSVPYALLAKSAESLIGGATVATTGSYNDLKNKPTAGNGILINGTNQISLNIASQAAGDMMYCDGTNWLRVPKGNTGQTLTLNSSGVPEWKNAPIPPSATTNAASKLYSNGIILNGIADGFGTSTVVSFEFGTTTSYGSKQNAVESPVTGSTAVTTELQNLGIGSTYHYRLKAVNANGTTYGPDLTFTFSDLYYGAQYAGGTVFYIDNTGKHGLVCTNSDQGTTGPAWGCTNTPIPGADGTAVGTGSQNTIDIEAVCSTAGTAADICANLVYNTFSDWFLPSVDELKLMYTNLKLNGLGAFPDEAYWSSTEFNAEFANYVHFQNGYINNITKNSTMNYVRAVRAF